MQKQIEISDKLKRAREYENTALNNAKMSQKQLFHLCAPVGWINDPNGFSEFNGEKHLFFQYHPYDVVWGPMHWGHAKTQDFIKWEILPVALAPDEEYDSFGCFSGSAIEYNGKHVIAYTGTKEVEIDGEKRLLQMQCIAEGDGVNYQKAEFNPVLTGKNLPTGGNEYDFRDPKIWVENDGVYMVVANRASDECGQILMYRTQDLKKWEYVTTLAASKGRYGKMWECPDFFKFGDKNVLMISPQEMQAIDGSFHAGDNTAFIIGGYDKDTYSFNEEKVYQVDSGLDFYAPQTMLTSDGRRIMTAWMQSWSACWFDKNDGFCGMMTVPRELELKGGKIYQQPVRELEKYYTDKTELHNIKAENKFVRYDELSGRCQDLELTFNAKDDYGFCLKVAADENYYTVISYNRADGELVFDRSFSGVRRDVAHRRSVKLLSNDDVLRLRILMDRYSVEIFINDGEQALTSIIRTPYETDGVYLKMNGNVTADIVKHEIKASKE